MGGFFSNGIVVGVCYTVVAGFVLFVARAVMQTFQGHQVKDRADRDLKVFLMGNEYNPGGWVGKVDDALAALATGQEETHAQLARLGADTTKP